MPLDKGTQEVTLKYYDPANANEVNARFQDIRQTGIYSGGRLTVVDGPTKAASLSPLVCEISDGTHQVKVETTTVVSITADVAKPYVVLKWTYSGATSDYMEILNVAAPSVNELVVAKCSFTGGGDLQGFDYGDISYPRSTPNTQDLFLKVEPTEDTELKVRIRAGQVCNVSGVSIVSDQKSDLFTAPSANSKVYLVYIDTSDGTIKIDSSGTEAVSPSPPDYAGKLVLAEITLASTDTNITAAMIKDVRSFVTTPVEPDGVTIERDGSTGKLQVVQSSLTSLNLDNLVHYDSGWFAVTASNSYTKNHSLSSVPRIVLVYISDTNVDGTGYYVQGVTGHNADAFTFGTYVYSITSTQITVKTNQRLTQVSGWAPTSGYAKIIAIK